MALSDLVQQGEYKGVQFETFTNRGRTPKKNAIHRYPNSRKRFVEELGVEDGVYELNLRIYGTDDYIQKRDNLLRVLQSEGEGVLIHPTLGERTVKCTDYTFEENIRENLGECTFNATFYEEPEQTTANPTQVTNNAISLANSNATNNLNLASMVNENIVITNSNNYTIALDKLNQFSSQMNTVGGLMPDPNAEFFTVLQNFENHIPEFLADPITLGSGIYDVFRQAESDLTSAQSRLTAFQTFFNFGDDDTPVTQNTIQRIERVKNNDALNIQIQINAWNVASNSINEINFENEDELQSVETILADQYSKMLKENFFEQATIIQALTIRNALQDGFIFLDNVFKAKEAQTPKIVDVMVANTSVSLTAYQYYDSVEQADALITLNNIKKPNLITGDLRIFTDV